MEQLLGPLRAAGDPTRLRLLAVLARAELTVTELTQVLGQSQPRLSRHLKLLVSAGLLNRFQEGSWVFFRPAEKGAGGALARFLNERIRSDDPTIARDLERLAVVREQRAETAAAYFRGRATEWNEIRALHIPEKDVEAAILDLLGDAAGGDLVDLGTGTGRVLELLAPHARSGIGVDLSREMLAIARHSLDRPELRHIQIRQGDLYALPLESASADIVTLHLVLHYLDDPAAALLEAARLLRPNGRLLIVDFAPHNLEFLRDEHAHRRLGFTQDEIAGWCRDAGLKIEATRSLQPKQAKSGERLTVMLWVARQTVDMSPKASPAAGKTRARTRKERTR
jgi:ubiquinone/menaquinone biosynthesis C-methylase UbiE/DNA-binding transcriptional ArsR family regulator